MIYIYAKRDRLTGSWSIPAFVKDDKEETIKAHVRFCTVNPAEATKQRLQDMEVYFLGTYDDREAQFVLLPNPEMLIDCGPIVEQNIKRLEVAKNA